MARTLALATLKKLGACANQVAKFHALFGASVEVTVELAVTHASEFDWDWAACRLLSAPAWAAYDSARAPARAAYEAARALAGAAYDSAMAPAWAAAYIGDAA